MSEKEFQDELTQSFVDMTQYWDKKGVHIPADELSQVSVALEKLSLFSKQTTPSECERIINEVRSIIKALSVEVRSEAKELQAETHGGQMFTEDELERINEYAYRRELVQWLNQALEMVYEVRPEFKPR